MDFEKIIYANEKLNSKRKSFIKKNIMLLQSYRKINVTVYVFGKLSSALIVFS